MSFRKLLFPIFWVLNLFIIIYFWQLHSFHFLFSGNSGDAVIAVARLFGLLAVYFVLLQFIFLGREVWLEQLWGLDRLTKIHHWNAQISISFIILHPLLMITGYALNLHVSLVYQFLDFFYDYDDILKAVISVILFILIVGISYAIVKRKLKYEIWYAIHLMTYIAIAFAWGHQLPLGKDFETRTFVYYWYLLYAFVFGNVLFYRFIRPSFYFLTQQFTVTNVIPETQNVTSVYISGKNLQAYPVKPGQFMIFRFLDWKNWWSAHPFSLSHPIENKTLRISVKNSGDFTSHIGKIQKGTPVIVDGPYGVFTLPEKQKKLVFIAAGIGITPIRSLIEEAGKKKKDIILLYSNRTKNDIVFKKELDELSNTFKFPIYYFLSQEKTPKTIFGRISKDTIAELIPEYSTWEYFICGPKQMMKSTRHALKALKIPAAQIHYEEFIL